MGAMSSKQLLSGAVVSEQTRASEIGTKILAQGGNAADAIVATIVAVNTLAMYHSDLGGGGFAIIRTAKGEYESLNFRHRAPLKATAEFYKDKSTSIGGSAVAVPGEVKGLWELHKRHGRLPWKDLFTDSIAYARDGQVLQGDLLAFIEAELPKGSRNRKGSWMETDKHYDIFFHPDGELLKSGESFKRVEYARALQAIAEGGADAFYTGSIAQGIADAVQASGGLLTVEDLKDYKVEWNQPISSKYKDYTLWTVPAPASGAIWLNAMGILGEFKSEGNGTITDLHRLTEVLRLAYGTRTQLGDPAFVPGVAEAQKTWISHEYAKERAKLVDDEKTHLPDYYKPPKVEIKNTNGTSNITVADSEGLVISVTTTVGLIFGSRIITKDGIVLNDSMDDFSVAGRPNGTGYEPSPANYIVGGKRPLSSSCPFIIVDSDNRPVLAGGAAGGSTIISANAQLARNVLDYGLSALDAQRSSRLHNQILPNVSLIEGPSERNGIKIDGFSEEQIEGLKAKGHAIELLKASRSTTCAIKFSYENGGIEWDPAGEPRKWDSGGSVFKP